MSLKPQPPQKVIKALSKLGFKIVRKHGSHVVLKHPDGRLNQLKRSIVLRGVMAVHILCSKCRKRTI